MGRTEGPMLELLVNNGPLEDGGWDDGWWLDRQRPSWVMSTDDPRFTRRGPLTFDDMVWWKLPATADGGGQ